MLHTMFYFSQPIRCVSTHLQLQLRLHFHQKAKPSLLVKRGFVSYYVPFPYIRFLTHCHLVQRPVHFYLFYKGLKEAMYIKRIGSGDESDHCSISLFKIHFISVPTRVVDIHKYDDDIGGRHENDTGN